MRSKVILTTVLVTCCSFSKADAAVGLCADTIISPLYEAATEPVAKKLALAHWQRLAGEHGPGFTRWNLAWNRRLLCEKTAQGTFKCQASAAPCTIQQVPPPPGETKPITRGTRDTI